MVGEPSPGDAPREPPGPAPRPAGARRAGARRVLPLPTLGRLSRRARVGAKTVVRRQVPGGARAAFRTDLTAMFLAGLYTGAVFPFITVIARDDLKAGPGILAFITAAPFLGNLLALFWARAMEGRRKVPFVKWSHLTARGTVLLCLFATSAWPFALILSAAQIIGTIATPAYAAIIKSVYPDDQRGRILSFTRAAILIAQVGTTLLAGWLMDHLEVPFQFIFATAALVGIAAALVFARIEPEDEQGEPAHRAGSEGQPRHGVTAELAATARFIWSTLRILREDTAFRWFALSVFLYGFGNLLTVPIIPVIQVDEMKIAKGQLGVLVNLTQIVAILSYFYWGRYVDRKGPQRAVVVNVLLNVLVPLTYILTGALHQPSAWTLLPAYVIMGVVGAGIDLSYFNAILIFSGPDNVSRYQALQSFLLGIRGSIAPFVGSAMVPLLQSHGLNLRWAFVLGIAFMLAGAWMQVVAMRRQEARRLLADRG
jgi:DHA1 family inner membrane transport protein